MRVALYARVSHEEQVRTGLSIDTQIAALDEWAKDKTVVGHYVDLGISARKPASARPELQRLLRDVEAGKIDLVAFCKLDRWFRNVKEYYKVQEVLDAHKVAWRAINEDYETETASGRFKVNIMLAIAEDEADRTSERVKAVFAEKRRKGLADVGAVPPGIDYNDGHLTPNADAEKVRELFRFYVSTRSLAKTATKAGDILGRPYSPQGMKYLLQNERYTTTGIVTRETWEQAQTILATRATRSARTDMVYLFSGLLVCPVCGCRLTVHNTIKKGQNYIYYRCGRNNKGHRCTWAGGVREETCEEYLLSKILPAIADYNVTVRKKQKKPVDTASIKRKLDRLTDLYVNEAIEKADYEKRAAPLRDQLKEAQLQPRPVDTAEILSTRDLYPRLSRGGRKAFWSHLLKSITPTEDGFSFEFSLPSVIKSVDFLRYSKTAK